jgi:NDP-sugar pyrophosphorylase family protein
MYPITANYPKHLLPIANKPLMGYILEHLEKYHAYGKSFTRLD